jgi:PTH1 family peptidyl-tRNA hydrolase
MKFLVAGLGNPGDEYSETRHNVGFKVVDLLASENQATWENGRYGWVCTISIKGKKLLLLKPGTYMNLSGKAISYWLQEEKIKMENLLVITDDLALPTGKLRLKMKGNNGGHNGLKSIDETLGTQEYARLRFGIGSDFAKGRQVEYVLGTWPEAERELLKDAISRCAQAVNAYVLEGAGRTMTKFNV